MIFAETKLPGAFVIEPKRLEDDRGFFARTFCQKEFGAYGINPRFVQCSISFNRKRGTLRGMHYQAAPHAERSPHKQGCYMPGVHVPIRAPESLLEEIPDYVLLLAWNFAEELLRQQEPYRRRGERFIVPIPEVRVA